jgi:hypothetical protein
MTTEKKKITKKNSTHITVYCLPEERDLIKSQAKATGLSMSNYLLKVGTGYQVPGILDHKRVDDLAKINADLGRLGGLLKLWLTNDEKINQFNAIQLRKTINAVLSKIYRNQDELREIMKEVVLK